MRLQIKREKECQRTEHELRIVATNMAEKTEIKNHRHATLEEKRVIRDIILGSLLSLKDGADVQSVADTARYICNSLEATAEVNGLNSVYLPIKKLKNNLIFYQNKEDF